MKIKVFWSDEDEGFIAIVPDLPGCSAWGASEAEAITELQDAIQAYVQSKAKSKEKEGKLMNKQREAFERLYAFDLEKAEDGDYLVFETSACFGFFCLGWKEALAEQQSSEPVAILVDELKAAKQSAEQWKAAALRFDAHSIKLRDKIKAMEAEQPSAEPAWPIRGVRVEDDKVIITVKGGNDAARWLCGKMLEQPSAMREACAWEEDDDGFNTSCGNKHVLISGTPNDNNMKYCCYCGKSVLEI
jgi:predicted RNase H-like HicB family nuclease